MFRQKTNSFQGIARQNASDSTTARWILLIAVLWCICWFVHAWHYWEDDAYIHLEFARSVATGHGYSFDGILVNGDTSPLWVLLLAGIHTLIPDWLVAGKILTVMGAVLALTGTYFFSMRLTNDLAGTRTFAAYMVLLLVTNPYFCYWSFSGMETLTAVGVAFWGTLMAVQETPTWWSFFAGCFLAGIAPVLRPEMLAFTGLLCLLLLRQWVRLPRATFSSEKVLKLVLGLMLVAVPLMLWSAYALHAFGHVIPNTNAAKRAALGDSVVKRLLFVYGLGFPLVLVEITGVAIVAAVRPGLIRTDPGKRSLLQILPAASWIFVIWSLAAAVFYVVDHTYVQTRYIFVMAPGLMIVILAVNYRRLPLWVYRASLAGALIAAVMVSTVDTWLLIRNKTIGDQKMQQMAEFVRKELPPDAPVAIYAIGEMAFDSQHSLIDVGGITRPGIIPYLTKDPGGIPGWVRGQGAKYWVTGDQPEPGAVLVYSVSTPIVGWSLNYRYYSQIGVLRLWKLPDSDATASPSLPATE